MTTEQFTTFADAVIEDLDAIGRNECSYEYGLPTYTRVAEMRAAVLKRLTELLGVVELKAAT